MEVQKSKKVMRLLKDEYGYYAVFLDELVENGTPELVIEAAHKIAMQKRAVRDIGRKAEDMPSPFCVVLGKGVILN